MQIVTVERREKTFQVKCTSTGGRPLSVFIVGPDGHISKVNRTEAVGDPRGMGNDMFSTTTNTIAGGTDGDVYKCTVSNSVSPDPTDSSELKG